MNRATTMVVLGATLTLLVGGTLAYRAGALNGVIGKPAPLVAQPPPPITPPDPNPNVVPLKSTARTISIPYFVVKQTDTDSVLVQESATLKTAGSASMWRQARTALSALHDFPRSQGSLENPLPPGAKIRGVHIDNNGIATVDLSPEFQSNFNGGAREEQVTLYAIVNTVGSVKGIAGVRFAVNGHPLDEFGGHVDLSSPLTPDMSLVEPAQ